MTRISSKPNIFRLAPKTDNIGAYSLIAPPDTTGMSPEQAQYAQQEYQKALKKLEEQYNKELLQAALQIKANIKEYAKEQNKSFDENDQLDAEYYIQLAQRMKIQGLVEASLAVNQSKLNGYPDMDSKWAGFSYEEIIQMENNGCNIPEEVLLWAHAQQQADITSYVIVSDNTLADDELNKEDNDINSLEKKVKQYVTKAENAIEASEKAFEQYKLDAEKANQIKKEKENTYKDQMQEISDLTQEWKALNEKKESGSLTDSEQQRFAEIGKQINGSNGTKMKEVKNAHTDLDNFLNSIDTLNDQITENTQISQDTTNATLELSKLTRNFANFVLPHDTKEMFINNGLLANSLQNVRGDEITEIAKNTVRELDETTSEIDKTLNDSANTELAGFSNDYTSLADKTESETKDTMGDDYDSQSSNNTESEEQKVINKDKYSIDKSFSFANSIAATGITIKSLTELNTKRATTEAEEKNLEKAMKASEKDNKNLNKETQKLQQQQAQNTQDEEKFLEELDSINENQPEQAEKPEDAEAKNAEKTGVISELENLNTNKNELNNGVQKVAAKSVASDKKTGKLATLLRTNSNELIKVNNNTKKVAEDTQYVGAGTTAKGIVTKMIGFGLCEIGTSMTASMNPATIAAGIKLIHAGIAMACLGDLEQATGMTAFATGSMALAVSDETHDTEQDAKDTEKSAKALIKSNKANLKEATEQANENKDKTTTQSSTASSADTSTTEGSEESQTTSTENQTDETGKTNENSKEKTQEKNTENKTTTNENQTAKAKEGYSVQLGFDAGHALAAAAITTIASIDANTSNDNARAKASAFKGQLKMIQQLEQQNEKAQRLSEAIHKQSIQKAAQTSAKIETANIEMEQGINAGNEEQAIAAQIEISNLNAEMNTTQAKENSSASQYAKTSNKVENNIKMYENSSKDLKKDVQDFNTQLDNQLDVTQKTLVVGSGTLSVGGAMQLAGFKTCVAGLNMLSNPVTHAIGEALIVAGEVQYEIGAAHILAGQTALVASATGFTSYETAKDTQRDTGDIQKAGDAQLKSSRQKSKDSQQQENARAKESQSAANEVIAMSASASTNTDIDDSSSSDSDKEDRKLARFNEESIIESKKKRKKVLAVSASSRG